MKVIKARNQLQFPSLASAKMILQLGACSSPFVCRSHLGDPTVSAAQLRRRAGRAAGRSGAAPALGLSQPQPKALGNARRSQGLLAPASPPVHPLRETQGDTLVTREISFPGQVPGNPAGFLLPTPVWSANGPGWQHLEAHATASACRIKGRVNSSPSKVTAS